VAVAVAPAVASAAEAAVPRARAAQEATTAAALAGAAVSAAAAPDRAAVPAGAATDATTMPAVLAVTAALTADRVVPTPTIALAGLGSAVTAEVRQAVAAPAHGTAPGREGPRTAASGDPDGTATAVLAAKPAGILTGTSAVKDVTGTSAVNDVIAISAVRAATGTSAVRAAIGTSAVRAAARPGGRRRVLSVAAAGVAPRTGQPARTAGTTVTGLPGNDALARTVDPRRGTAVARATAEPAPRAVAENGASGIRAGIAATSAGSTGKASAAMTAGPAGNDLAGRRTAVTPSAVAAATGRTGVTGTTAGSGAPLATARTGHGAAEGSAMTSLEHDGRLATSGQLAGAASAGTCQTALGVHSLTSARTAEGVLIAAHGRSGVMMAATGAKTSPVRLRTALSERRAPEARPGPGRAGQPTARGLARAGRSGRGARAVPVPSPAPAPARGQAPPRARDLTAAGPTAAVAATQPRRGFRRASPRTSFPGRRRLNSTGSPPTWPPSSAGIW